MARPSKLTPEQWDEVKKRRLAGESFGNLAKDYGISKAAIIKQIGNRLVTVKDVANQIVTTEANLRRLPVTDQLLAISLSDKLRSISTHAAGAADNGMAIAHRLTGIGRMLVEQVDDADPLASMEQLKAVAVIGKIANDAAHIGLNLLNANKGQMPVDPPAAPKDLPEDVQDAALAYAKYMG